MDKPYHFGDHESRWRFFHLLSVFAHHVDIAICFQGTRAGIFCIDHNVFLALFKKNVSNTVEEIRIPVYFRSRVL